MCAGCDDDSGGRIVCSSSRNACTADSAVPSEIPFQPFSRNKKGSVPRNSSSAFASNPRCKRRRLRDELQDFGSRSHPEGKVHQKS